MGQYGNAHQKYATACCARLLYTPPKLTSVTLSHVCKHEQMFTWIHQQILSSLQKYTAICSILITQLGICLICRAFRFVFLQKSPNCNTNHCVTTLTLSCAHCFSSKHRTQVSVAQCEDLSVSTTLAHTGTHRQ